MLVILSGGEVLVRPDLDRIGLELYRREYPWGMVTNGLALDEKRFDRLLRAGLHSITVSLDGFREDHNYLRGSEKSYDAALRAVRLTAHEPTIASDVVTCVTARSLGRLPEFREMLIAEGVRSWRLFTIFPLGRAAQDPSLQLDDEQFTRLMEFIRDTRKEGRIRASYGCEGNATPASPWLRSAWTAPSRAAPRSVRIIIRATSTATTSGRCGKTASSRSASGNGPAGTTAPTARCSATAWAGACTCTTATDACCFVITNA